jgi:hypothetical protein
MDNTQNGVTGASPAPQSTPRSEADIGAMAGSDFAGAAMEYLSAQDSIPEDDASEAKADGDSSVEAGADEESDSSESRSENDKNTLSPGVKRRIDGLSAKLKVEQAARKEAALENAKLREAIRLYSHELDRVAGFAKLDPQAEKIRELELQREIDQIEQRIPRDIEEQFEAQAREEEVTQRAQDIADQIYGATAQWDGVFSARELALYMKQHQIPDANRAANDLGNLRIQAAQRRGGNTQPPAPNTANVRGANAARESAQPWRYRGANSILDFFDTQDSQRGKRR